LRAGVFRASRLPPGTLSVPDEARVTRRKSTARTRADERESQPLRERDILETALRLIRSVGGEEFSMRLLATELGVTPMAIYHHVPNKAALVSKLGDLVLADASTPPPSGHDWQRELKKYALEGWTRLAAHPGLTDLLLKHEATKEQRRLIGYGASILIAAGFSKHVAGLAITTYNTFIFGVMSTQAQLNRARATAAAAAATPASGRRTNKAAKPDRFMEYLYALDFRELVEYGIDSIIAGLEAQRPEQRENTVRQRAARVARRP
jgi:AcrR family transcriptional regulator